MFWIYIQAFHFDKKTIKNHIVMKKEYEYQMILYISHSGKLLEKI